MFPQRIITDIGINNVGT